MTVKEEFLEAWQDQISDLEYFIIDLDELLKQEAKDVFRYVHRFGTLTEDQLEELYKLYKDNQK